MQARQRQRNGRPNEPGAGGARKVSGSNKSACSVPQLSAHLEKRKHPHTRVLADARVLLQ